MTADLFWKIALAAAGGAWTILNYLRGRTFRRRLELKVTGEILIESDIRFLSIVATIKNVGLSKARIFQEGTWVKIFRLQKKTQSDALALPHETRLGTGPIFAAHGWVEPGEEVNDVLFVQLPAKTPEDIAVRVEFRVKSQERRWLPPAEFEQVDDAAEADEYIVRNLTWVTAAIVPLAAPPTSTEAPTIKAGELS